MNRTLTSPDTLRPVQIAGVTFTAQRTIEGGITITVWCGPSRHNSTSWSYLDSTLARARWNTIAHLAVTGMSAAQVAETLNSDAAHALNAVADLLRDAHERATANSCHSLARAVTTALDEVETDAEKAKLDKLAADVARTVEQAHGQCAADRAEPARVRTLAEMRAGFTATHPQPTADPPTRRRRRRRVSPALAYDTAKARADR